MSGIEPLIDKNQKEEEEDKRKWFHLARALCEMWPVRTRRGTRKRCAALFVVGLCAAVMVVTRPFLMTPMIQLVDDVVALPPAPPMPLTAANDTSFLLGVQQQQDVETETPVQQPAVVAGGKSLLSSSDSVTSLLPQLSADISSLNKKILRVFIPEMTTTPPPPPPSTTGTDSVPLSSTADSAVALSTTVAVTTTPATTSSTTTTVATTTTPAKVTANVKSQQQKKQRSAEVVTTTTAAPVPPPIAAALRNSVTYDQMPTIYVITPTFPRMEQMPELTRLGQTLKHVSKLFWIVADDAVRKSADVDALLKHLAINHTYILGAMPEAYRKRKGSKPKGVANRMAGLQWIRKYADSNGVMFLADDDNSYDVRLFDEMRWTKKVSMWPVGLVTQLGVSTPVVRNGKVVDFYDGWIATRKFPVDMAGFAVNIGFLRSRPKAAMPFKAGFEEDGFLRSLNITLSDIEPKADNCTKIYVWHTRTVSNKVPQKLSAKDRQRFNNSNLFHLPHIV